MSALDLATRADEGLRRLEADDDQLVQAVGRAIRRTVEDDLDPAERGWVDAIERLRTTLDASSEEVDTALPNARGIRKPMLLGDVAGRRSKKGPWAALLLALGRELRPAQVLELGTCLGISGAFLAAASWLNGTGRLTTLEGAPVLAERARAHFDELGLGDVRVVSGLFRDTLDGVLEGLDPIGLAFVDGHHDEQATQEYFVQLLPHLDDPAVVVFDDIAWSDGMARAWRALRAHPAVRHAVDLDKVGICVVGSGTRTRVAELPALSTMAAERRRAAAPVVPVALDLDAFPVRRLNWGCGARGEPGWINSDRKRGPDIQLTGDIRDGLALPDGCVDYVVSLHALTMIPPPEVVPVLEELRRVLRPGGVLRLGLPDFEKGVAAWQRGHRSYFVVPDDDARTTSGKLLTQLLWYGHSVSLFTAEWAGELLERAGFEQVEHCRFGQTASEHPGIVELDNRPAESLFVEGTVPDVTADASDRGRS